MSNERLGLPVCACPFLVRGVSVSHCGILPARDGVVVDAARLRQCVDVARIWRLSSFRGSVCVVLPLVDPGRVRLCIHVHQVRPGSVILHVHFPAGVCVSCRDALWYFRLGTRPAAAACACTCVDAWDLSTTARHARVGMPMLAR
jgi:hypothetical protein